MSFIDFITNRPEVIVMSVFALAIATFYVFYVFSPERIKTKK